MKNAFKALSSCGTGIAVFIIATALYLPLAFNDISMLDEGALLYVAERLTKGDVLYRDIVTGIMPGVYYLQALFFLILGYSVLVGRVLAWATLAATGVLLYYISTHFIKKRTALFITLFFISIALPAYRWPGYSQMSITFVLICLLFFLRYLGSSSLTALLISGAGAGLALLFKQNFGVFIAAAIGFVLLARLISKKELRPVLVFSISFAVPILLTILYFYSMGALAQMTQYTFISLFQEAANAYYKPYPLLSRADPFFYYNELNDFIPFRDLAIWILKEGITGETWIKALVGIIYLLPPIIIVVAGIYTLLCILRSKSVPWKPATLALTSFFIFLGVFPRSDIHHLVFILPTILVTGALLTERLPLSGRTLSVSRGAAFGLTGLFAIICLFSTYMPLVYPPPGEEKRALQIPRAYSIQAETKSTAVIRAITSHIKANTTPEEPVLVVPTGAMYYFLTGRKSAVPYPLIMPGAMDEAEVIETIESKELKYIIYSDMSFDEETLSTHMPRIHRYITKNYRIDETYPMAETGGDTYVLKRGAVKEDIIPVNDEASAALNEGSGNEALYYDFVKELPEARSGVILGNGRGIPPFRANQITRNAWLLKDAILQIPGRRWSKVYTAFSVHVPPDSALRFSIGQSPLVWHRELGDGALFEVYVYDTGTGSLEKLFSRYIDPKNNMFDRRWFTYMAGLKKYWGRDLIIAFVTSGGPRFNLTTGEMNRWRQIDKAGWGGAALMSFKERAAGAGRIVPGKIPGTGLPVDAIAEMARFDDISFFLEEKEKYPGDYDVRLALGRVYDRNGESDKAVEEFRAALKAYPAGSEARNLLARYYIKAKKIEKAEGLLREGLTLTPGDPRLNMTMADIYRGRSEYDKAMAGYSRVLRARPKHEWARIGLGRSYLATGKAGKAMAEAEKALRARPGSSGALVLLGDSYRFKKEWKRAEERYREALESAPGSFTAAYRLGQSLMAGGRPDDALRTFQSILSGKGATEAEKQLAEKKIAAILRHKKEKD
ncbi:MAG: tetratricopeptide repeat protein [Thermodesulfobacteriota bacterium]